MIEFVRNYIDKLNDGNIDKESILDKLNEHREDLDKLNIISKEVDTLIENKTSKDMETKVKNSKPLPSTLDIPTHPDYKYASSSTTNTPNATDTPNTQDTLNTSDTPNSSVTPNSPITSYTPFTPFTPHTLDALENEIKTNEEKLSKLDKVSDSNAPEKEDLLDEKKYYLDQKAKHLISVLHEARKTQLNDIDEDKLLKDTTDLKSKVDELEKLANEVKNRKL